MKRVRLVVPILAAVGAAAHAAEAPAPVQAPAAAPAKPAAAPTDCWSSAWSWFSARPSVCPLSAMGFTLYGALDLNATWLAEGAPNNPSMDKLFYAIQKPASGPRAMLGYNGLTASVIGLKMKEDILPGGWSVIGVVEVAVNPTSGRLLNGPRTLADNNLRPMNAPPFQTANTDSNRAGQWDNQQAFLGVSHPTWGALTFGRTNALALDVAAVYDPVASIAFSMVGYSASFPGFGDTETARNTAVTWRVSHDNLRAALQAAVGGYAWGNGDSAQYQAQLGADFGRLSLDGVVSYAWNAVSLSSYSGANTVCAEGGAACFVSVNRALYDPNTVLKATLSNNAGLELAARYDLGPVTLYGGWLAARLANPSDRFLGGFQTIAPGIFIPAGYWSGGALVNDAVVSNAYDRNRVLNTVWTGFKWSLTSTLDIRAGVYYLAQNNYNFTVGPAGVARPAACVGTGAFTNSPRCAGSQDAVSLLIDYRPVPRVDLYAGAMVSNVYGGLASGYVSTYPAVPGGAKIAWTTARTRNWDPSVGLRIRF